MEEDYKEIKNILHNDLGITKAEIHNKIMQALVSTIRNEVVKALNDKCFIENVVRDMVKNEIYKQDSTRKSYLHCTLDKLYNQIDSVIHEEVLNRLVIALKEPDDVPITDGIKYLSESKEDNK